MRHSYTEDRRWSDAYAPAVQRTLGEVFFQPAGLVDDRERATDFLVFALPTPAMRIGCRVRQITYKQRFPFDFTIRASRDSGARTELQKITDGWGDFLFYGFGEDDLSIQRWVLLDLAALRAYWIRALSAASQGRRHGMRVTANGDGTHFLAIDAREIREHGVVHATSRDYWETLAPDAVPDAEVPF